MRCATSGHWFKAAGKAESITPDISRFYHNGSAPRQQHRLRHPPAMAGRGRRLLARQHAYIGQVAVALGVVQPVADDKFVRDAEADVISHDRLFAARWLVQQGGNLERLRLMRQQNALQIGEGEAGIQDVFHQNYVLVAQGMVYVFRKPHLARRIPPAFQLLSRAGTVAVARYADEIECRVKLHLPCQVAKKNRGPLEHAHEDDRLPGKVVGDLGTDFRHPGGNLFPWNQNGGFHRGAHIKPSRHDHPRCTRGGGSIEWKTLTRAVGTWQSAWQPLHAVRRIWR